MSESMIKVSAASVRRWGRRLKIFHRRRGHSFVPAVYPSDPGLAKWCAKTRREFHRYPVDRLKELLKLRFNFGWDKAFVKGFCALADFKLKHGHSKVPRGRSQGGLAGWVHRQRNQRHRLSAQRRHLLDRLDFDWCPFQTQWAESFRQLQAFRRKYGHCNVSQEGPEPALGRWATRQRINFRQERVKGRRLSARQKQLLDKVGFDWSPEESLWWKRLAEVRAYKAREGKLPSSWKEPVLGTWLKVQRQRRRKGMVAAQRKELEALGVQWRPVHTCWERRFAELRAYKKQFGSCTVPSTWKLNTALGNWVASQRERHKRGTLPPEHVRRLDRLGFDWVGNPTGPRVSWEERFRQLREFKRRFGHCQVPAMWAENTPLGAWVRHQRVLHKHGKLPGNQRKRLEGLGFRWKVEKHIITNPWR
jgi:hypothetical protein